MLDGLFPADVVVVAATAADWEAPLYPEEEASLGEGSVTKRRREFAAGRACARAALQKLGLPPTPLPRAPNRLPLWPDGALGSISHCPDYCAAAVARTARYAGLGLDLERTGRARPELVRRICTDAEQAQLAEWRGAGVADPLTVVFSVKEAFYKAVHPLTGAHLGFRDVEIQLDPEAAGFTARLLRADVSPAAGRRSFTGRFACHDDRVVAGLAITRS